MERSRAPRLASSAACVGVPLGAQAVLMPRRPLTLPGCYNLPVTLSKEPAIRGVRREVRHLEKDHREQEEVATETETTAVARTSTASDQRMASRRQL